MRTRKLFLPVVLGTLLLIGAWDDSCGNDTAPPQSASGVHQTATVVPTGSDGLTVEQRNVRDRLQMDNRVGSIKHLYVLSAYSGQVIMYSTVKGKVTSSGKRLTPTSVLAADPYQAPTHGINVDIGGNSQLTSEVLQDDGTYGSSVEYLYWWDVRGAYHQLYVTGGEIVMISDQPLPIKSVIINIEGVNEK